MKQIPPALRKELASDSYYQLCCLCSYSQGKIEFHHNLIFGGSQSNIKETILPLCLACHLIARRSEIKEKLDLIMLRRMTDETITSISRAINYHQRLKYLEDKYLNVV